MLIPDKVTNFMCYGGAGATTLLGVVTAELPAFEAMTETLSGAGIAGELATVVQGHFSSQTLKMTFRTVTADMLGLLAQVTHAIQLRGSMQVHDSALGRTTSRALVSDAQGPLKVLTPGKLEPGKGMDAAVDLEIQAIVITIDGEPVVELDKLNMVFVVDGVDYLRQIRQDIGGV
jgi:P2 family phage contractile tail tube protein